MSDLASQLKEIGIDDSTLRTLRDVVVADDIELQEIPINEIEEKYPIYTLETAFDETIPLWEKLKGNIETLQHIPVILGGRDSLGKHWEMRDEAEMPEAYLSLAKAVNARQWLDKKYAQFYSHTYDNPFTEADILGKWQNVQPYNTFKMSNIHFDNDTKPNFYIGLIPTTKNWEIPAYLGYGCWNDCPCAEFHVAIQHYWHDRYGGEIVALLNDRMIMHMTQPVTDQDAALLLARDQMVYCHDVVMQVYRTINGCAAALLDSKYWLFWWD